MKNETITRIVLILEIGAVILFHTLKNNSQENDKVVDNIQTPSSITFEQSPSIVLTSVK
jgi:hypothetical protein